jgi:hypothetical protein
MRSQFKEISLVISLLLVTGCTTYQEEDYSDPKAYANKTSKCINMDSTQEALCKENEHKLLISLGDSQNCDSPYDYQRNSCTNKKAKQKKLLDESLEKHKK